VYRRSLALPAALAVMLVLVPAALAARVHVRVEGKTQTIFGTTEPTLDVKANALDALEAAPDFRGRPIAIYEGGGALIQLSHTRDEWHRALYHRLVSVLQPPPSSAPSH